MSSQPVKHAVIIAAGMATRLRPMTDDTPKCMLDFHGRPLLHRAVETLRSFGIDDISVVTGYLKDKVLAPGITKYVNVDYASNNILHSLMYAREKLEQVRHQGAPILISYGDLYYEPKVIESLLSHSSENCIAVDKDWAASYEGRDQDPYTDAELVEDDGSGRVSAIGKGIRRRQDGPAGLGEFTGIWRMSGEALGAFIDLFDTLNQSLQPNDPFQKSASWKKAYASDFLQEMVDQGTAFGISATAGGNYEFDTVEDYHRFRRQLQHLEQNP